MLVKDDATVRKLIQLSIIVGSLLHAAKATRPDIAHAVGKVSGSVLHLLRPI